MINPIDKAYGFEAYALIHSAHPNKPVTQLQVENGSIVPEPSCVVNISQDYYLMLNCFTGTNLPD